MAQPLLLLLLLSLLSAAPVAHAASPCDSSGFVSNLQLSLSSQSHTCQNDGNVPAEAFSTYRSGYVRGRLYLVNGATMTFEESLVVAGGGYILVGGPASPAATIHAQSIDVQASAYIWGNQRRCTDTSSVENDPCGGYAQLLGPGAGGSRTSQGGTHGGRGYGNSDKPYGSFLTPTMAGSGGGTGNHNDCAAGKGGAALHIVALSKITVNGEIDMGGARGNGCSGGNRYNYQYSGGGGAGGSLWLETNEFTGQGIIKAYGGDGGGAGHSWTHQGMAGAGGRIAVAYEV